MIGTCCNSVIDKIFNNLTTLYGKENKGQRSHTILIMATKCNEITFVNVDTASKIVIERVLDITYVIHVYDHHKRKSPIDYYVSEDRVQKWDTLYKNFKELIETDPSFEIIKEAECITSKFFA